MCGCVCVCVCGCVMVCWVCVCVYGDMVVYMQRYKPSMQRLQPRLAITLVSSALVLGGCHSLIVLCLQNLCSSTLLMISFKTLAVRLPTDQVQLHVVCVCSQYPLLYRHWSWGDCVCVCVCVCVCSQYPLLYRHWSWGDCVCVCVCS